MDLKEACIIEAFGIIAQEGLEKLSLREVARRLGVSHQAPYKHFESRNHILAEIVARAFADFARHLDAHPKTGDPAADMGRMGRAYLAYAASHPLEYRLMFGTPLPDPHAHPQMMREARHAFALLCDALARKAALAGETRTADAIHLDALFIWSGLHGLATISASPVTATLGLDPALMAAGRERLLQGFAAALDGTTVPETNKAAPEGGLASDPTPAKAQRE